MELTNKLEAWTCHPYTDLAPTARRLPTSSAAAAAAAAAQFREERHLPLFLHQSSDKSNQSPHVYRKLLKLSSSESNKLSLIHILLILSVSLQVRRSERITLISLQKRSLAIMRHILKDFCFDKLVMPLQ